MEETGKEKRYSREPEANQIKKRDRRRKKGSLTVEASLVVPVVCDDSYLSAFAYFLCVFAMLVYAGSM